MGVDKTPERLIATAERLFAERGFDGVTLKQITAEAGQRNASALQYHFGSKVDLVRAIVMRRMPKIDARRNAMLDEVESSGRARDMRAIVAAMINPVAEQLDGRAEGRYYIGFLTQVWSNPRSGFADAVRQEQYSSVVRAGSMAAALLEPLPRKLVAQRLSTLPGTILHALADHQRRVLAHQGGVGSTALFVSDLCDSIVGMLTAAVSNETREELERRRSAQEPALP